MSNPQGMHEVSRRCVGRGQRGFTLMELLVAAGILSVMAGAALPSVLSALQSTRISMQINGFLGDLRYARTQAITRGQRVSVCASSDGATCSGAAEWNNGWIVFVERDEEAGMTAPKLLRVQPGWKSSDSFVADGPASAITFHRFGFAPGLRPTPMTLTLHTRPFRSSATRRVAIGANGRYEVQHAGSGACV